MYWYVFITTDQLHWSPTLEIVLGFVALVKTNTKHQVDVAHWVLVAILIAILIASVLIWATSWPWTLWAFCHRGKLPWKLKSELISNVGEEEESGVAGKVAIWRGMDGVCRFVHQVRLVSCEKQVSQVHFGNCLWEQNLRSVQKRQASTTLHASTVLSITWGQVKLKWNILTKHPHHPHDHPHHPYNHPHLLLHLDLLNLQLGGESHL